MKLPALIFGNLKTRVPIIQGGMGVGISLSGLASAVAREGGIGVISAAFPGINEPYFSKNSDEANKRVLRDEIRKARKLTDGILGVNIMVALTNYGDMVRTSLEEGVDLIFAGAGLPLDLPGYLAAHHKTKLVPIISSARAAKIICKKWLHRFDYLPDGFVVEGPKAGGHIGLKREQISDPDFSLETLVKEVIDIVQKFEAETHKAIPVIPAGGIYNGDDIHKFMKLGAAGVQLGTRFVATVECEAHPGFKRRVVEAGAEDAVLYGPPGLVSRGLANPLVQRMIELEQAGASAEELLAVRGTDRARRGCVEGEVDEGILPSGSGVGLVQALPTVAQLVTDLMDGARARTEALARGLGERGVEV